MDCFSDATLGADVCGLVRTSFCSGAEISWLTSFKAGLGVCREVLFVLETGGAVSVGGADRGVGVVLSS